MSAVVVAGYQRFRGPCCFHLQSEGAIRTSEMLVFYHNITQHGLTTQKTLDFRMDVLIMKIFFMWFNPSSNWASFPTSDIFLSMTMRSKY